MAGGEEEEESSGKTLMELLELEMRARAIKALLKKEEEGEDEGEKADEWADDLVAPAGPAGPVGSAPPPVPPAPLAIPTIPAPPVSARDDAIQRPFRAGQSDYSDKHKQQSIGHGHHQQHHRPSDLAPICGSATKVSSVASYRPASSVSADVGQNRRHQSSSVHYDNDRGDQVAFRKSHQPRHYRHHHHQQHHHQQQQHHRRYDHQDRSRSPLRQSLVKTEPKKNSPESFDRRPSPFLATPPKQTDKPAVGTILAGQEMKEEEEDVVENDTATGVVEREDEVEYEEEGIQEVDIELGSGSGSSSEDDAHSTRI